MNSEANEVFMEGFCERDRKRSNRQDGQTEAWRRRWNEWQREGITK